MSLVAVSTDITNVSEHDSNTVYNVKTDDLAYFVEHLIKDLPVRAIHIRVTVDNEAA